MSHTMVKETTESKKGYFANWSDFLLPKLHSYGVSLNLRWALAPYYHHQWSYKWPHACEHNDSTIP